MGIIKGFDGSGFITRNLDTSTLLQNLLLAPDLLDYNLATTVAEAKKARKWTGCKRVVAGTAPGEEESTLTVQISSIDWGAMQFAYGELATNVNATVPILKTLKVPAVTPFEVVDTEVTAGTAASVKAYLAEKVGTEQPGYLQKVTAAPSAARTFQADGTATKLIFHSGLAGAAITYVIEKPLTAVPSIGKAPSPVKIGDLQFVGYACSDEWPNDMMIHIPKIQYTGKPSINTADDVPVLEVPFECVVAPGEREAIHYYLLPSA
jgi:hypothetical protein